MPSERKIFSWPPLRFGRTLASRPAAVVPIQRDRVRWNDWPGSERMEWTAEAIRRKQKELLFPNVGTYYEQPLALESGKGMFVKDVEGREYLDFYGGRSALALSMMGNKSYRPRTQSEVPGIRFAHAPYCYRCDFGLKYPDCGVACAKDLKPLIETTTDGEIAAFMAEPIQGVGGFITPPKEYFEVAVPIARNAGGLFIADEVQTAWGRTGGKWWGVQQYGVEPDVLTSAKGMANGQPIGLTMAKAPVADKGTFANISTFGASPISMAAAIATLKVIEEEKLLFNAQMMGKALREGLESLQQRFPGIGEVRGMGLMQAIG